MNKDSTVAIGITLGVILIIGLVVYSSRTKPNTIPTPNPLAEIDTPETTMTTEIKKTNSKSYNQKPAMIIDEKKDYSAVITTSLGVITIDLLEKVAPETVNNFVFLAKEGFYNDTFFHRVIDGFMIQGGDPTGTGSGSPGYKFADEILEGEYTRGTLAMANSGPNTNGSQFFIMHQDNALPNNYVIFGKTLDEVSLKTIDTIAASKVSMNQFGEKSTPVEKTYITSIEIVEK